ncbi:aldo/keto reductase [Oceanobacillus caeni]|uniref:aldo/keto reductase n=1 Tax=Oceanobacillus caeni TaxID=405946 RepID=UPI002E1E81A4
MHELALKYVLKHPAVTSTVFGASSINQINENTNINLESELPNEVYNELKTITKPIKYKDHR